MPALSRLFAPLLAIVLMMPAVSHAQEYDLGLYEDEETMRADQAIVGDLVRRGGAALEAGNWTAASMACGDLNEHLYNSPFMREPANKAASEMSMPCYADAQAMLGDIESACRVYAQIDYTGLLSSIDPRAVCENSANPAPPTREEAIRAEFDHIRAQLVGMNDVMGVLNKLPAGDPGRAARIAELRGFCRALPVRTTYYEVVTTAFARFCDGQAYLHEGNIPELCAASRESDAAFTRLGMPLPPGTPHTDWVEGLKAALAHILSQRCAGQ